MGVLIIVGLRLSRIRVVCCLRLRVPSVRLLLRSSAAITGRTGND
jgi:hypothetical protein